MTEAAIRIVETEDDYRQARGLVHEYAAWLDIDLCFQSFDEEMTHIASVYGPPRGRLLLAKDGDQAVGCVGLRPITVAGEGEIKRLFVRSSHRGIGLGNALFTRIIGEARALGYRRLRLDTLPRRMPAACAMYRRLGWVETPAYYNNPVPGVVFYRLDLG